MKRIFAVATALSLCLHISIAFAGKGIVVEPKSEIGEGRRLALVIGNQQYENVETLKNTLTDADAVSNELRLLGYRVYSGANMSRSEMTSLFREFLDNIRGDSEVVVYYSGHGVEVNGANYLIPTDFPKPAASTERAMSRLLDDDAVALGRIMLDLQEQKARTSIIILDACRENPLRPPGGKAVGGAFGLAGISPPTGMYVLYSAGANQISFDRLDRLPEGDNDPNGVFTRYLLKAMSQPGLEVRDMLRRVREDVREATTKYASREQFPTGYDQLDGNFYFIPPNAPPPVPPAGGDANPSPAPPAPSLQDVAARNAWDAVKDTSSIAVLKAFLQNYPRTLYSDFARARLAELEAAVPAPAPPEPAPIVRPPKPVLVPAPAPAPAAGDWFVILGSFPHGDRGKAVARQAWLSRQGLRTGIIDTDNYPNLTDGYFAVVIGPFSKNAAQQMLASARGYVGDAYIKSGY